MFILYKIKIVSLLRAQEGEKKNQSSSLRMRQFSRWCAQQLSLGSLETVSQWAHRPVETRLSRPVSSYEKPTL